VLARRVAVVGGQPAGRPAPLRILDDHRNAGHDVKLGRRTVEDVVVPLGGE
jgi:hypothetical protein